jgi:glucose-1-phosphate thymidylyltransferase
MTATLIRKAVVLAAGRGSRMRRTVGEAVLSGAVEQAVRSGRKMLIPAGGRPFLDHVLQSLVDAGYDRLCLVLAPDADEVRERYAPLTGTDTGPRLSFAEQAEPRGTADALLAATDFIGEDPFLVLNADNLYPHEVLIALRELPPPALPAFAADGLATGNVPPERIAEMALLRIDAEGWLTDLVEKPGPGEADPGHRAVSMNCWTFTPAILEACRTIPPHPVRGEVELPLAARWAVRHLGLRIRTFPVSAPVWDLTRATDIASVERALEGSRVTLPGVDS